MQFLSPMCCYVLAFFTGIFLEKATSQYDQVEANALRFLGNLEEFQNTPSEIVFLLDSSDSIGASRWPLEVDFVRQVSTIFTVSFNTSRVAVVSYSSADKIYTRIDHITEPAKKNKCTLLVQLEDDLPYTGGARVTSDALTRAKNLLRSGRDGAPKLVILLTAGHSNGGDPVPIATVMKESGISIFVIGLGEGIDQDELTRIASDDNIYLIDQLGKISDLAARLKGDVKDSDAWDRNIDNSVCNVLCDDISGTKTSCCDAQALCSCAINSGSIECACAEGYSGSGLNGQCTKCPFGTYKDVYGNQDCTVCPPHSVTKIEGSTSKSDCVCEEGYTGNPANDKSCEAIRCEQLANSPGVDMFPADCDNVLGTTCSFLCQAGYGQNTGTETEVTCLSSGVWSASPLQCTKITCEALPIPRNGQRDCSSASLEIGTTCQTNCNEGYELDGDSTRTCTQAKDSTGTWSGNELICQDITPPELNSCPENVKQGNDPGLSSASVMWIPPSASDNSGLDPILTSNFNPGDLFEIGTTEVKYVATDVNQLKSQPCTFKVTVRDVEKPRLVSCPADIKKKSSERSTSVTWPDPVFIDNSGKDVILTHSKPSGDIFYWGKKEEVRIEGRDDAGNLEVCSFFVQVKQHLCPFYPAPANGALACETWLGGQFCTVSCQNGYDFSRTPEKLYFCSASANGEPTWSEFPDPFRDPDLVFEMPWPDCSGVVPSNADVDLSVQYYADSCNSKEGVLEIKNDLVRRFEDLNSFYIGLCNDPDTCRVENVDVFCGPDVTPPELNNCPDNIEQGNDPGLSSASVIWIPPTASGNPGLAPILTSNFNPGDSFDIGNTEVKYVATDVNQLKSQPCTFTVTVRDVEKPVLVSCPADITKESSERSTSVTWPDPVFIDNSGKDVILTHSRPSGDIFYWGKEEEVRIEGRDDAGNLEVCSFFVHMKQNSCPFYPAPANGALACETWLGGQFCTVSCQQGYGFSRVPENLYFCATNANGDPTWSLFPDPFRDPSLQFVIPWPDCSHVVPSNADVDLNVQIYADSCYTEKGKQEIQNDVIRKFQNLNNIFIGLCSDPDSCKVENVNVVCG